MVEHLQSSDQTMAPEDSAWQAMPNFSKIRCTVADQNTDGELLKFSVRILCKGHPVFHLLCNTKFHHRTVTCSGTPMQYICPMIVT